MIEKYKIKSVRLPFRRFDIKGCEEITEYSNTVVETKSLSSEDWAKCFLFASFAKVLHCKGLFHCISMYVHDQYKIDYGEFYYRLMQHFINDKDSNLSEILRQLYSKLISLSRGQGSWTCNFEKYNMFGVSVEDVLYDFCFSDLASIIEDGLAEFRNEIGDDDFFSMVCKYQLFYFDIKVKNTMDRTEEFNIDFIDFFNKLYLGESPSVDIGDYFYSRADLERIIH